MRCIKCKSFTPKGEKRTYEYLCEKHKNDVVTDYGWHGFSDNGLGKQKTKDLKTCKRCGVKVGKKFTYCRPCSYDVTTNAKFSHAELTPILNMTSSLPLEGKSRKETTLRNIINFINKWETDPTGKYNSIWLKAQISNQLEHLWQEAFSRGKHE